MTISYVVCQGFPLTEIGLTTWKDMKKSSVFETPNAASYPMDGNRGIGMSFFPETVSNRIKEAFLSSFR
jgi:hypothetical protein